MNKQRSIYQRFLDDTVARLKEGETLTRRQLQEWLTSTEKYLNAVSELTSDEIELIREYYRADLQSFARSYQQYQQSFHDSPFYQGLVDTFWQSLADVTDKTQCAWRELLTDDPHHGQYQAGEWVGLGQLRCQQCHASRAITRPTQLTPCDHCGHTIFIRTSF